MSKLDTIAKMGRCLMSIATSKWAKYIKERENTEVIETPQGFAIYKINQNECYIQDIYVEPDLRKQNVASKIADQIAVIAKEKGCKYLSGSICPSAKNSHASLLVLLAYGMKLHSSQNNIIYFVKELV